MIVVVASVIACCSGSSRSRRHVRLTLCCHKEERFVEILSGKDAARVRNGEWRWNARTWCQTYDLSSESTWNLCLCCGLRTPFFPACSATLSASSCCCICAAALRAVSKSASSLRFSSAVSCSTAFSAPLMSSSSRFLSSGELSDDCGRCSNIVRKSAWIAGLSALTPFIPTRVRFTLCRTGCVYAQQMHEQPQTISQAQRGLRVTCLAIAHTSQ